MSDTTIERPDTGASEREGDTTSDTTGDTTLAEVDAALGRQVLSDNLVQGYVRVVRVLIYEGTEEAVRKTLEKGGVPAIGIRKERNITIRSAVSDNASESVKNEDIRALIRVAVGQVETVEGGD